MIWVPKRGIALPSRQHGYFTLPGGIGVSKPSGTPPVSYAAWNPADKHANITLSDNDRRATSSATFRSVRSLYPKSTGKFYFEWQYNVLLVGGRRGGIGIGNASASLALIAGGDVNSWALLGRGDGSFPAGVYSSSAIANNAAWNHSPATRGGIAVDLDAGDIWWSLDGAYLSGGDPAAGTGATITSISGGPYMIIWGGENGASLTIYCDPADWTYSAPSGFSAWTA